MSFKLLSIASVLGVVRAAEQYPSLPTWKCTTSGGCVQQNTSVVLDVGSVVTGGNPAGSRTLADYETKGVTTSGNAVTMYEYMDGVNASPRLYLLGSNEQYVEMSLLNQEISVTVDYSTLPCGENGAFYLSAMAANGAGGSERGTSATGGGYCDAQCPSGACCNEMDILEANSQATAMTPHPCEGNSCDSGGCGYNPYASGLKSFYAPGGTVDTSKVFTVVTQFVATNGVLSSVVRKYIQNGVTTAGGTITTCNDSTGGLTQMGEALETGMVLVMSIWNDNSQFMNWLDSGSAGPCSSTAGNPATIQSKNPNTHVVFSNIRWGDIGSTTT